jgi:hypothetical protein
MRKTPNDDIILGEKWQPILRKLQPTYGDY